MKMRLPISLRGRRPLLLLAALAVLASVGAVVAVTVLLSEPAESQPGSPVAHPELVTPRPFTPPATIHPPDTANPPRCQAPADERPAPDLPPLPCRNSGNEPPTGVIPTPGPADAVSPQNAPAGWQVADNPMFRYTLAIPPDWYANMRAEGGEFYVLDPVALEEDANPGADPPGGVVMHFTAWGPPAAKISATPVPFDPQAYAPNATSASFGGYPGAIWEEQLSGEEGLVLRVFAAFKKDGVTFQARTNFGVGLSDAQVEAEAAVVQQILTTITPY